MFSVFWLVLWHLRCSVPEKTSESACGCGFPTELFGAVHNLGLGKNRKISDFSKCPHWFGMGVSENYRKNMLFQMHYSHTWGRIAAWRKTKISISWFESIFFSLELKVFFFFRKSHEQMNTTHEHMNTVRTHEQMNRINDEHNTWIHECMNTWTHEQSQHSKNTWTHEHITWTHEHRNTWTHEHLNRRTHEHLNT